MTRILLALLVAAAASALVQPAQAQQLQRMSYIDFKTTSPPNDLRALWADQIARNNSSFPPALSNLRSASGDAPAQALVARAGSVLVSILSSPITCVSAGSNNPATFTTCIARIQVQGRIVRGDACFVSADFDPLPGQTTANTYSTIEHDEARRIVRFGAIDKGRGIPECRIEIRY
jgi:hypothetical protein